MSRNADSYSDEAFTDVVKSLETNMSVIYYWSFQGDASDEVYSNCQCLTYYSIYLG